MMKRSLLYVCSLIPLEVCCLSLAGWSYIGSCELKNIFKNQITNRNPYEIEIQMNQTTNFEYAGITFLSGQDDQFNSIMGKLQYLGHQICYDPFIPGYIPYFKLGKIMIVNSSFQIFRLSIIDRSSWEDVSIYSSTINIPYTLFPFDESLPMLCIIANSSIRFLKVLLNLKSSEIEVNTRVQLLFISLEIKLSEVYLNHVQLSDKPLDVCPAIYLESSSLLISSSQFTFHHRDDIFNNDCSMNINSNEFSIINTMIIDEYLQLRIKGNSDYPSNEVQSIINESNFTLYSLTIELNRSLYLQDFQVLFSEEFSIDAGHNNLTLLNTTLTLVSLVDTQTLPRVTIISDIIDIVHSRIYVSYFENQNTSENICARELNFTSRAIKLAFSIIGVIRLELYSELLLIIHTKFRKFNISGQSQLSLINDQLYLKNLIIEGINIRITTTQVVITNCQMTLCFLEINAFVINIKNVSIIQAKDCYDTFKDSSINFNSKQSISIRNSYVKHNKILLTSQNTIWIHRVTFNCNVFNNNTIIVTSEVMLNINCSMFSNNQKIMFSSHNMSIFSLVFTNSKSTNYPLLYINSTKELIINQCFLKNNQFSIGLEVFSRRIDIKRILFHNSSIQNSAQLDQETYIINLKGTVVRINYLAVLNVNFTGNSIWNFIDVENVQKISIANISFAFNYLQCANFALVKSFSSVNVTFQQLMFENNKRDIELIMNQSTDNLSDVKMDKEYQYFLKQFGKKLKENNYPIRIFRLSNIKSIQMEYIHVIMNPTVKIIIIDFAQKILKFTILINVMILCGRLNIWQKNGTESQAIILNAPMEEVNASKILLIGLQIEKSTTIIITHQFDDGSIGKIYIQQIQWINCLIYPFNRSLINLQVQKHAQIYIKQIRFINITQFKDHSQVKYELFPSIAIFILAKLASSHVSSIYANNINLVNLRFFFISVNTSLVTNLTISDSTFSNIISINSQNITISRCRIKNIFVTQKSGFLQVFNARLVYLQLFSFTNCQFKSRSISLIEVERKVLVNVQGIYAMNSTNARFLVGNEIELAMEKSLFCNLSLTKGTNNGTVLQLFKSSVNISTTRFDRISGGEFGGAVYINNDIFPLKGQIVFFGPQVVFSQCSGMYGGALFARVLTPHPLNIIKFVDNYASGEQNDMMSVPDRVWLTLIQSKVEDDQNKILKTFDFKSLRSNAKLVLKEQWINCLITPIIHLLEKDIVRTIEWFDALYFLDLAPIRYKFDSGQYTFPKLQAKTMRLNFELINSIARNNSMQNITLSIDFKFSPCLPGFIRVNEICQICSINTYTIGLDSTKCLECPESATCQSIYIYTQPQIIPYTKQSKGIGDDHSILIRQSIAMFNLKVVANLENLKNIVPQGTQALNVNCVIFMGSDGQIIMRERIVSHVQNAIPLKKFSNITLYMPQIQLMISYNSNVQHNLVQYLRFTGFVPFGVSGLFNDNVYLKTLIFHTQMLLVTINLRNIRLLNSITETFSGFLKSFQQAETFVYSVDCLFGQLPYSLPSIAYLDIIVTIAFIFLSIVVAQLVLFLMRVIGQSRRHYQLFIIVYQYWSCIPSVYNTLIRSITCTKVFDESFIEADISQLCFDRNHIYVLLYLVLPIFIIILASTMVAYKKLSNKGLQQRESQKTTTLFGHIYKEYKISIAYYDIVKHYIKFLIILLVNVLVETSQSSVNLIIITLIGQNCLTSHKKPFYFHKCQKLDVLELEMLILSILCSQVMIQADQYMVLYISAFMLCCCNLYLFSKLFFYILSSTLLSIDLTMAKNRILKCFPRLRNYRFIIIQPFKVFRHWKLIKSRLLVQNNEEAYQGGTHGPAKDQEEYIYLSMFY